jgi:F0F1-type ATP synthase assembly protein I
MLALGMRRWMAALGVLGVGFFVAGSIILGVIGGRWLDGKMGSEPVWTIVGLVLGIVVAFYGVYVMVRPFIRNEQDKGNS